MYQQILYTVLTYFRYRTDESTHLLTIRDVCSDLINESSKNGWITWEQSSSYGSVIFPKHNIVCRIILKALGVILVVTFEYSALDLPLKFGNFDPCDLPPAV